MPPLTDPERRRHYFHALSNWNCGGYVACTKLAAEYIRERFGMALREFYRRMWEHANAQDDAIDEVRERRPEYSEHEFHHDLRFEIDGVKVYVETRLLVERDIDDTRIYVVNAHDA